ncbi:dUTP diphosphatase [Candidatus Saccharibacteria bacterium]|nr:MAG: dUTP diphosphatase [Candidatus Saccharibacteria bacterium]
MKIRIKKLHKAAQYPEYQTEYAAGMDVVACIDAPVTIAPHERAIVPTGFAIALPPGYEAQIRARSGMAAKYGIMPANGVGTIDADYRGEVGVILLNTSNEVFTVEPGMRIAQMVVSQYERVDWQDAASLDDTKRGKGAYGSTGHN